MKLSYKILTILFILFVFCASHVYAIDMFLNSTSANTNSQIVQDENFLDETEEISNESSENYTFETSDENENVMYLTTEKNIENTSSDLSAIPTITTTGVQTDSTLSVSDIINIILIAVCVVLILLAIAILIRCK